MEEFLGIFFIIGVFLILVVGITGVFSPSRNQLIQFPVNSASYIECNDGYLYTYDGKGVAHRVELNNKIINCSLVQK